MSEKKTLTLGSLFDGSGSFPFGGILAGIEPKWNSEIEPFPVLVTHKRLPQVKHYGDVSGINGGDLEPVDIITFGSPCQDLSIAGKRAGIREGERSGLFFQAIRIIKEMREKTNGEYPRYCVWENVPGAFSSNRGDDFKAVLEAVIGVKEEGIEVPSPENHRWPKADVYLGDGWSVAYRVLDAQYWSVPQRRARIYLVADFAGGSAGEVLFKSEGLSGYTPQGFRAWEGAAGGAEEGAGEAGGRPDAGSGVICVNTQGNSGVGITEDKTLALVAQDHGNHPSVVQAAGFSTEHSAQSRSIGYEEEVSPTLRAGVVPAAMMFDNHPQDCRYDGPMENSPTVTARYGTGGNNQPLVAEPEPVTLKMRSGKPGGGKGPLTQVNKSATLGCNNDQTLFQPAYGIAKEAFNAGEKAGFNFAVNEEVSPTIQAHGPHAVAKPEIRAFGVCSKQSHSMLSDNPHSGFYEAETSRTLDQGGGNPTCNQGGICIVAPVPDERETYDVRFTSEGTKNARGHCYKTDISRCLNTSEANPDSNHGGIAVLALEPGAASRVGGHVYDDGKCGTLRANAGDNQQAVVAFTQNQRNEVRDLDGKSGALQAQPGMKQQTYVLQGSMIGREDKNGPQGDGINEDVSFTLNTIDRHAVVAPVDDEHATYCATTGSYMTVDKEKTPPLMARDYKDPQVINDTETPGEREKPEPMYIVRRLTPIECARLQGFPDWWCSGLAIPDPTDEELAFWAEVWETWRKATNPDGKPKTEKQLRRWLADPYTDAAEYKLWGNGISLPIVFFVLSGIAWAAGKDET